MPRDPRAYLWDARQAAERVVGFVAGRTWQEYAGDVLLRSAVERQFEIVGEALNKLRGVDDAIAAEIADLPRIVAFRNLLIHGYATIDDALVWEIATERAEPLVATLNRLLGEG
ncbi:MAG TPA: HepT-like ribonuclease domain-containing protein [Frankiaceae bacterium]|nr:HepT-like ribonuclease domain-containing protein [Frankiaceae bacterium]